jgi:hypothetical protein
MKKRCAIFLKFKGTVLRDFFLQDYFMNHLPPSPPPQFPKSPSGFFEKMLATQAAPPASHTGGKFTDGIVDTGGKFIAGVNDTGGYIFAERYSILISLAPAENLPPVSMTPVVSNTLQ